MMQTLHSECLWLTRHLEVSLSELAELSGVDESEVREWMDAGCIAPADPQAASPRFGADRVDIVVKACRLRRDFELEPHGVALIVQLLEQIQGLEAEIRELRASRPSECSDTDGHGVR